VCTLEARLAAAEAAREAERVSMQAAVQQKEATYTEAYKAHVMTLRCASAD
jgi:hypothetical protein